MKSEVKDTATSKRLGNTGLAYTINRTTKIFSVHLDTSVILKLQVNFTLEQAMKAQKERISTTLLFLQPRL